MAQWYRRHALQAKVTVDEIDKPPRMLAKISEMGREAQRCIEQ
jgi:hypothetical protein